MGTEFSFHFSKRECADAHFDAACDAFLRGDHPTVIVTLAGIAEELYGALIKSSDGWTKDDHPRAVDSIIDWASGPDGVGVDREDAWKLIYAAKNAVKHGRDVAELAYVDPAIVVYMITMAVTNRLSVDPMIEGSATEVTKWLSFLWAHRPDWVKAEAEKWKSRRS